MAKIKFEHKITFAYILIGSLWIIFSDKLLNSIIADSTHITEVQTYKGWFYVLITGILLFIFLKKHLKTLRNTEKELEKHKTNLQQLVLEKTEKLNTTIKQLSSSNAEISSKSAIIDNQNIELKKTLRELMDTQSRLLQADKMASLGILTAGIAHEINNPLNYIMGGITGLEKGIDKNKKTQLYVDSIKTGIERINSIVSGLNQFSRNKNTYDETCNVHEIIDNCLTIIHNQLKNRIEVVKNFANPEPVISGNVGQLHQVFINILMNAIHSIDNKGNINITTQESNGNVYVEISDTGCGIEQENLPHITDPFFTTKEPGKGTGLGLSITYNIIKDHKGLLNFESEPGKGTTVKIILPTKSEQA
ncbi:MAG: ATP-binding protein [Salinivirgaceae bacterium]|jgi:signal transduction histidine kinase